MYNYGKLTRIEKAAVIYMAVSVLIIVLIPTRAVCTAGNATIVPIEKKTMLFGALVVLRLHCK